MRRVQVAVDVSSADGGLVLHAVGSAVRFKGYLQVNCFGFRILGFRV